MLNITNEPTDVIEITGEIEKTAQSTEWCAEYSKQRQGVAEMYRENYKLATTLSKSKIIPESYQGNQADVLIALDMADRIGVSPIMVMQNLYVVKGKPSWSGQACISFIRNKFKNIKVLYTGKKGTDDRGCYIKAADDDGDVLEGSTVTIDMAKKEGWYGKNGSKWQTMPEQMLAYRAAAFFARIYCPEVLMGCHVEGEAEDIAALNERKSLDVDF